MRKISSEELQTVLDEHRLWMESRGNEGVKANLGDVDLRGANLAGAKLQGISFLHADLMNANLLGADLSHTDFWCANLIGTKFDIGIVNAYWIREAHFSVDALPWLMLRSNWVEERDHVYIHEEWSIKLKREIQSRRFLLKR
jgi:hypothetical protein